MSAEGFVPPAYPYDRLVLQLKDVYPPSEGLRSFRPDGHRIATPSQRQALIARDQGCSFPGCDIPPACCETHHVIEFQHGGKTSVDTLALACGHHHRNHENSAGPVR